MKMKLEILVVACNELVAANDSAPESLFQLAEGGALRVPFGDYPQQVLLAGANLAEAERAGVRVGRDGRVTIIQRFDAEAANEMAADLASLRGRVTRFFLGAPIYNGHPFHPDPKRRTDYPDKRAYGWIKGIEVEEKAALLVGSYNTLGKEAIGDGQLVFHSPEWSMRFVGVENGVGVYRPVRLRSTGLTNEPNIPVPPLVAANERAVRQRVVTADEISDEFAESARELLDAGRRADLEPLAIAVNEALSGDDEGLLERLQGLRERLPELAAAVRAGNAEVEALEQILGAAAANGLAAAAEGQGQTPNNEDDMLKKLLELLAAAGIIQADDPEDTVLTKLGGMKEEMNWKREEMARQAMEAERIRAALPAANVAELGDVPLLSAELMTATANTITSLRGERDQFRKALTEATLQRLTAEGTLTGADIEATRTTLMAANDRAGFDAAVQEICTRRAVTPQQRVTEGLTGGRERLVAANDSGAQAAERRELVMKHQLRLGKGRSSLAAYDAAWAAAKRERPDLF